MAAPSICRCSKYLQMLQVSGISLWLLSAFVSHNKKYNIETTEAGAVEILTGKISSILPYNQLDVDEDSSIWISTQLLTILFQYLDIIRTSPTTEAMPPLASLLRSEDPTNRYFAAQATASLVCNGNRGTLLSIANSGAASGLISMPGCANADIHDLLPFGPTNSSSTGEIIGNHCYLFQDETLAQSPDAAAASACQALVNLLEDQPSEEMKVVAMCALQNLVMYSRSNKRAVAEAGRDQVVLDLIASSEDDTSVQAAMFIKLLFSNNAVQDYVSIETVRSINCSYLVILTL